MSQANKQTTGPSNEGSVTSRTRTQTRIRGRDDGDEKAQSATPSSSHVSPAMRIYRHALESIFGMLELQDLIEILSVSHSFAAAVRSMAPINASIDLDYWRSESVRPIRPLPTIASIVGSPLLRHLAVIHIWSTGAPGTPLDNASLALLAQHAPHLTSLRCDLTLTPCAPLVLPAKFLTLTLQLNDEYAEAVINGVLTALAAFPSLSHLQLELVAFERRSSVDLSLLAACRSLADLTLVTTIEDLPPKFCGAQVNQIRSCLGHLQRFSVEGMETDDLKRFLQPPVTARWSDIGEVHSDARTGELLPRLPTLDKLDLFYHGDAERADFLPQLPLLTSLTLNCSKPGDDDAQQAWSIPSDALLHSLLQCTGLTHLDLTCGFTPAHWSALLAKLPKLRKLSICGGEEMETLQCCATGPITQSLEELSIQGISLPPSEISHLSALRRLRSLRLLYRLSPPLADATITTLPLHSFQRSPRCLFAKLTATSSAKGRRLSGCSGD